MPSIKTGDRLDAYHDGKASPSRLVVVAVDYVAPLEDLPGKYVRMWRKALREDFKNVVDGGAFYVLSSKSSGKGWTKRFWDWNCDEFAVGHIDGDERTRKDPMLFAKRSAGFGWYCVNWNYALDVGGRIRKSSLKKWKACARENGRRMKWNAAKREYEYFDAETGEKVEA